MGKSNAPHVSGMLGGNLGSRVMIVVGSLGQGRRLCERGDGTRRLGFERIGLASTIALASEKLSGDAPQGCPEGDGSIHRGGGAITYA